MVSFGSFVIDTRTWTLTDHGHAVDLSPRLVEILAHIVEQQGEIVTKDDLLERFWPDTHISENTLARAIADIRKALGDSAGRPAVIQTLARRGYRFVGLPAPVDVGADPLRRWVSGRLALESLDESRLDEAIQSFEAASEAMPDYAAAHAGVANAWLVRFEGTRLRNCPDMSALERALQAASRACSLDARLGEGWAVLSHALVLAGRSPEALAAARRAVYCEPGNWRHHYRLALADWGEGRLRAADRARALLPSCAAAYFLEAMVFVARGAWTLAADAAAIGARLQDEQPATATLPAAGLHWMRGMVLTGVDHTAAASAAFEREAHGSRAPGIYGREFAWHASVALGFLHLHQDRIAAANESFLRADATMPGTARAALGRSLCGTTTSGELGEALNNLSRSGRVTEAAMVRAASLAWNGDRGAAMRHVEGVVLGTPSGPTAWSLAADPMFLPCRSAAGMEHLMASIAARAG